VALEQHERLCHKVRARPPRCGTHRRDLTGADGLAVVLVLGIAKGAENDDGCGAGVDSASQRGATRTWSPMSAYLLPYIGNGG
jgi:hypothetical protein